MAGLAAVLFSLGSALAQAPQSCPVSPMTCTTPLPPSAYCPPPAPSGYGYSMPSPASPQPGCTFSATKEGGALRLLMVGNDGLRSSCEKTTLLINGAAPVTIRVDDAGKQVLVGNDIDVKGSAERVNRGGTDGAILTLEGKAQLRCWRNGHQAEMTGERILVNLLTGHVEAELGAPQPATPAPPTPVTSTTTGPGPGNPALSFTYGMGPFR